MEQRPPGRGLAKAGENQLPAHKTSPRTVALCWRYPPGTPTPPSEYRRRHATPAPRQPQSDRLGPTTEHRQPAPRPQLTARMLELADPPLPVMPAVSAASIALTFARSLYQIGSQLVRYQ
jgi:hypothetical protein